MQSNSIRYALRQFKADNSAYSFPAHNFDEWLGFVCAATQEWSVINKHKSIKGLRLK